MKVFGSFLKVNINNGKNSNSFAGDKIAIFFAIHFDDLTEKTIAKLILQEMEESRRHVQNAPSIQKMHEDKIPEILTQEFPGSKLLQKKFSNGLIGLSIL